LGWGLLVTLVSLALSACGGGQENEKGAIGGPPTNGQIAFRRWFDPDQTKGARFTMNPEGRPAPLQQLGLVPVPGES
jgi:hypothetical protein